MSRVRRTGLLLLLVALTPFVMASNCDKPNPLAKINYEQLGACNGFANAHGVSSAGTNQAYAVFRISTIDNTSSGTKDFEFDPNKLFVTQDPRAYASTNLELWGANPFSVYGRMVKAGSTETFNGAFLIVVSTVDPDGAKEASKTSYLPLYETPSGSQPALMVKAHLDRTEWPYTPNCTDIIY